jgi:tetratricopeptide (TPR) repeat protein
MTKAGNKTKESTSAVKSPKAPSNGSRAEKPQTSPEQVPVPAPTKVAEPVAAPEPVATEAKPDENQLRENGNTAFKNGQFKKASKLYSEAIELILEASLATLTPNTDSPEFISLMRSNECLLKAYNNRAQCFLNVEKWPSAVDDTTKILHAIPEDTKALYRRSQAYQSLGKYAEALRDAQLLLRLENNNMTFVEYIQRLNGKIQDVAHEQQSTKSQTAKMLELAVDAALETKVTALNNLIVLTREDAGCQAIVAAGGLPTMVTLLTSG